VSLFGRRAVEATAATPERPPEEARTVEAGLSAFAAKYEAAGAAIPLTRFGRFLENRTFVCDVAGSPQAYTLALGSTGAALSAGKDPSAHVTLTLEASDWTDVLYGDYTGLAPVINGRSYVARDEANSGVLLLLVMYVFAHLPAGADYDPAFLAGTINGSVQRGGVEECETAPPAFERAEGFREDPQGRGEEELLGTTDAPPVTRELAEWVADLEYEDVPATEIEAAKDQLRSVLGVVYAGSTMPTAGRFTEAFDAVAGDGDATVVAGGSAAPADAALLNSYQAQVLEWEDFTHLSHSGAAIVPTAVAAAEVADASGTELLTAVVAGNEIIARLGEFLTDVVHAGQAQAVHQAELPFVAGTVLGLDADQLRDAAGIAATQPQMTSIPAWTADAKGLVTGQPAHTAVRAARLAAEGVSGRRDLLENPLGYFYRVADIRSPRELYRATDGLGDEWRFSAQRFDKRYPTNGFHLTAVHAALQVREALEQRDGVDPSGPEVLRSVELRMPLVMAATGTMFGEGSLDYLDDLVLDDDHPDWTHIALCYDAVYPVLAALLEGEFTHRQYEESLVGDERIRARFERTEAVPDLSMGIFGAQVTVETAAGAVAEAGVDDLAAEVPGLAESPLASRRELAFVGCIEADVNEGYTPEDKFREASGDVLSDGRQRAVLAAIDDLERRSVRSLTSRL
jgi:2-methylcitrate dehydratase PrpD